MLTLIALLLTPSRERLESPEDWARTCNPAAGEPPEGAIYWPGADAWGRRAGLGNCLPWGCQGNGLRHQSGGMHTTGVFRNLRSSWIMWHGWSGDWWMDHNILLIYMISWLWSCFGYMTDRLDRPLSGMLNECSLAVLIEGGFQFLLRVHDDRAVRQPAPRWACPKPAKTAGDCPRR